MRRRIALTARQFSALTANEGSAKNSKTSSQSHQKYFYAFRDFVAKHKFLRESAVFESMAKFCDFRLGIVVDVNQPFRPSVLEELAELQHKYSALLVAHGVCQEQYMTKATEYDNAKSILIIQTQPNLEKARNSYDTIKGKFDDCREQHINLQQQIQVRKDAQKAQMEYENLKIEIQEGYMLDVDKDIIKNNDALLRSKEVYGDGDLLTEILPRLHQIGQKAEARRKALQTAIEEMKRLRDKIVERNEMEAQRDASLLKASGEPMSGF